MDEDDNGKFMGLNLLGSKVSQKDRNLYKFVIASRTKINNQGSHRHGKPWKMKK